MSRCLNAGDVNFDHLVKVVSTKFLSCTDMIFSFVIIKYLVGRYFEAVQIACLSHT